MSKFVKNLIIRDIAARFEGVESVAVINPRGIDATINNGIRRRLHATGMRMTVVKNALAKKALADTKLKGFESLLEGPCAVIYGKASIPAVARLLMEEKKKYDKLELRGVFFDGDLYAGEDGVRAASKLPTREEAIANIVGAALSPGRKLGGIFKAQAGKVAALVKAVEEKAKKAAPPAEAPAAEAAAAGDAPAAPAGA